VSVVVERAGLLGTLQDLGRHGHQHEGVPVNGAMDLVSHRLANRLVGNDESEATLELTLSGPRLRFERDAIVALGGADLDAHVDGRRMPLARPIRVPEGSVIDFGKALDGGRGYLAVAGGFDAVPMLGSRSTAVRGGYGGHRGRALRKGDVLALRDSDAAAAPRWMRVLPPQGRRFVAPPWAVTRLGLIGRADPLPVRVVPGRHWPMFPVAVREQLDAEVFRVGADSDRMGFRLEGTVLATRRGHDETLSEGVPCGAVQVPPGGRPIVLMADRQTTGGYPVIANVISADLPSLAQMRPGESLMFVTVARDVAYAALAARERELARLGEAISLRLEGGRT
jgi:antagonist of KipI